jgi:hypothetical protein
VSGRGAAARTEPVEKRPLRVASVAIALVAVSLVGVGHRARAAAPEDAPAEARAQVAAALRALEPAFAARTRVLTAGTEGTIESVIAQFAPAKFHPVTEGALGPARVGARCPAEMSLVAERVCVDRYEASLAVRAESGTLVTASPYATPNVGRVYIAQSRAGAVPQAYLSAAQAQSACLEAGKRLCYPVEWRAACGGTQGYAFPYGPTLRPGVCHDAGVAPMIVLHLDAVKRGLDGLSLNDPAANRLNGTLAKTGAYPGCVNDYGIYDMVGNLHEWTADPNGTFQGGYWLDTAEHGTGCAYRTIAHPFDYHDYSTGFRCCADPLPPAAAAPAPASPARVTPATIGGADASAPREGAPRDAGRR